MFVRAVLVNARANPDVCRNSRAAHSVNGGLQGSLSEWSFKKLQESLTHMAVFDGLHDFLPFSEAGV